MLVGVICGSSRIQLAKGHNRQVLVQGKVLPQGESCFIYFCLLCEYKADFSGPQQHVVHRPSTH